MFSSGSGGGSSSSSTVSIRISIISIIIIIRMIISIISISTISIPDNVEDPLRICHWNVEMFTGMRSFSELSGCQGCPVCSLECRSVI